jgi:hypothetical protein
LIYTYVLLICLLIVVPLNKDTLIALKACIATFGTKQPRRTTPETYIDNIVFHVVVVCVVGAVVAL